MLSHNHVISPLLCFGKRKNKRNINIDLVVKTSQSSKRAIHDRPADLYLEL